MLVFDFSLEEQRFIISFNFPFLLLSVISISPHLLSKFTILRNPLLVFYMQDQSGLNGFTDKLYILPSLLFPV
ncbi:hypothetical protein Bca101_067199 [Brassica carinata]